MKVIQRAIRKFTFDSGHRVYKHESKCANLHGHTYKLLVHAESPELDSLGRVIDFSVIKEKFHNWLEQNWDHGFLWSFEDNLCRELFTVQFLEMKNFKCSFNPTAENMAKFLLTTVGPMLMHGTEVTITRIELWETENCHVDVFLKPNCCEVYIPTLST